ncbi:MAG: phenylalanine--tRNA ligase subunit beta [Armatimonadota bacterium]|nr:phenylalanine--tRNA ligase subunit beta [Armatimonadota bacterium]MDR7536130.1 phenylalanine--tRNA ligase subunit beta [Armatimonadota bacterium]
MRVPLGWLREFVDLPEPVEVLAERLPMLGLGVERVEAAGNGETVLDLEIASNRPDLLSLVGIARELAAWGRRAVRLPDDVVGEHDPAAAQAAAVEIADPDLCPRYIAHVITDVRVRPSPAPIAARLEAAGIRPINNIVDATNYVMLEWGQPMHAFDLARLADRRIVVRRAREGETLLTLDEIPRRLDPEMLVIADARRPVALAGIMGGAETEIAPATTTVLLEAASFAPATVRRTSRRLGLRTEASARFERGVDPDLTPRAARRAARLIAELSGGRVLRGAVDVYPTPVARPAIRLRLARIRRLLGTDVPAAEVVEILTRLGLEVTPPSPGAGDAAAVVAIPPVGRRDLEREEDLIEEVARHHGYDRIPETMPVEALAQGRRSPRLEAEAAARDVLIRTGLTEAMTVSLAHPRLIERLGLAPDDPWRQMVPIANPLTAEHTHLRSCLLPGLLEAARVNTSRRQPAVHLFEIGRVFRRTAGPPRAAIDERRALGVLMRGRWMVGDWQAPEADRAVTFYHLTGALEALVRELRAGRLEVIAGGPGWLHPHRAARLVLDGLVLGVAGELHPEVAGRFELPGRTYVAEVDLDALLDRAVLKPQFVAPPRYPAVRRDVAVVAPVALPHAAVAGALREIVGEWLEAIELFDVYTGPPLSPGTRNLAYTLTLRAPDRTLTGEEVEEVMRRLEAVLPARLPVAIRGSAAGGGGPA